MKRVMAGVLVCSILVSLGPAYASAAVSTGYLNASNRFVWQQPSPQGNPLSAVDFVGGNLGWAVGDNGTVIRTTDGGMTWVQQGPIVMQGGGTTRTNLNDVCFVDSTTGFIAGGGAVYKTADAGTTWSQTSAWSYDGVSPREIAYVSTDFSDANNGWMVGSYHVWHTSDGGTTVTQQTIGIDTPPTFVDAASSSTAYMAGLFDGYLKTTDGGATWIHKTYSGTAHVAGWTESLAVASGSCAWVVVGGDLLRTADSGSTWTTQTVGNRGNDPIARVFAVDGDTAGNAAYAFTEGGRLYRTGDGGQNWMPMTESRRFSGMTALDAPTGYALRGIDRARLVTSENGGSDWDASTQTSRAYVAVDFTSATRGFAITSGDFASTADGGTTWSVTDWSGRNIAMNELRFLESDPMMGWIVGAPLAAGSSTVLRTTNGGATWESMPETHMAATGVCFADALHGWAYDNAWGRFFHTTDGGASWTPVAHDGWFRDVDFVDANNGWIAFGTGDGYDRLLHTADGGSTWTTQTATHTGGEILSVDFVDATHGYFTDSFDTVWKTVDGGATWTQKQLWPWGPDFDLKGVRFTTQTDGWVFGTQMTSEMSPSYRHDFAAHTVDGGATWDFYADPVASDRGSTGSAVWLKAIDSFGGDTWIVGGNGSILKTRPKTEPVIGNPVAPKTMYRSKGRTVYGTLKPRHGSGVTVVRIYKYRLEGSTWKPYGYVSAKAVDFSTYSRYKATVKLTKSGKWRLRAFALPDGVHLGKWSSGYTRVTVK